MSKFCCTCIHWDGAIIHRAGDEFGICKDIVASSKIIQDRETKLNEDSTLYTEKFFGCVYWRDSFESIIKIGDSKRLKKDK